MCQLINDLRLPLRMHSELGMGEHVVFCNGYNAAIPFQISWHSPNLLHTIVHSQSLVYMNLMLFICSTVRLFLYDNLSPSSS